MLLENKNAVRIGVVQTFACEGAAMTGKILNVTWFASGGRAKLQGKKLL